MPSSNPDDARAQVLDRMERTDLFIRVVVIAAALVEALLFVVAFMFVDWQDPLHRLLFLFSVLGYMIVALGLMALGGHVSRTVGRLVLALEQRPS